MSIDTDKIAMANARPGLEWLDGWRRGAACRSLPYGATVYTTQGYDAGRNAYAKHSDVRAHDPNFCHGFRQGVWGSGTMPQGAPREFFQGLIIGGAAWDRVEPPEGIGRE